MTVCSDMRSEWLTEGRTALDVAETEEIKAILRAAPEDTRLGDSFRLTLQGGDISELKSPLVQSWTENFAEKHILGKGKFGTVYKGKLPLTVARSYGLPFVAVKRMIATTSVSTATAAATSNSNRDKALMEAALRREIRVLSKFRHPNIITLLGYCIDGPNKCLVYQLGEKGDLWHALHDDNVATEITWLIRLRIAIGVASALNYLHCHEIGNPAYHRDVKSGNIVLMADFTPKLIDCGLAKYHCNDVPLDENVFGQTMQSTLPHQRFGTQGYMCRDYLAYGEYDAKSEVFSLAIVLLELFHGKTQGYLVNGKNVYLERAANAIRGFYLDPDTRMFGDVIRGADVFRGEGDLYLALVNECVSNREARISEVAVVLRRLRTMEDRCSKRLLDEAQNMLAETKNKLLEYENERNEQLRLRELEAEAERQENQRLQLEKHRVCLVCYDESVIENGVECFAQTKHFICKGCLADQVRNQIGAESRGRFEECDGQIVCSLCLPETVSKYTDRDIILSVPEETYMLYRAAHDEAIPHKAEVEVLRRVAQVPRADSVQVHRNHIAEEILTLHCRNPNGCKAAILDFDGCFSITCNRCNKDFCGWCLKYCDKDGHRHVANCPDNPHRPRVFNTQEQFNRVHNQRRRQEIIRYLAEEVPSEEMRKNVRQAIATDLEPLGIVL